MDVVSLLIYRAMSGSGGQTPVATDVSYDNTTSGLLADNVQNAIDELSSEKINTSEKGTANGVAELNENGIVLTSQLPSYVDDVLEYNTYSDFPQEGESGKIYVDLSTNKTYRWGGSNYTEISPSLALGETSSTAYRGDRGKVAYDHSQLTTGNPHNVTKAQVGLGNVDNTSDLNKPISTATQTALDTKLSEDDLYNMTEYSTVSGNPVTLKTLAKTSAKSCEVTFSPIQSGSGDPSPENVRPISGWDSVVLAQSGKNLVNWNVAKFSGGTGLVVTLIKGTYTLSQSVDVNTGNWYIKAQKSDSTYCSKDELGLSSWASSSTTGVYYGSNNAHYITFTIPENYVEVQVGTQTNPATDTPAQLEVGSVRIDYVPYVSYSTKTATFPSTIMGGEYDFVSGKAKSEWGYIASYNGETITEPWISDRDVYAEGTTPSTGAEVCYKLATPQEITLTPETIELLKGNNVLFTDGDNIEIVYEKLDLTELPDVTSADEGKVLTVNSSGEWVAQTLPDGTNISY